MLRRILCALALLAACTQTRAASPTVEHIRSTGILHCGTDESVAEYSMTDEHGSRVAFDTDICKAIATALGPAIKVDLKGYPDEDTALAALQSGEVDLVASVSDSLSRASTDVDFSRPVLYDGASFLVKRSPAITKAADLSGKKICFLAETEVEENLRSWFAQNKLDLLPFPFQEEGEMEAAFVTGNCTALSGDLTRLGNTRAAFGPQAKEYIFLPQVISTDTLAAAYRSNDPGFANIVKWTLEVLLFAEENGTTSKNIRAKEHNENPALLKMRGKTHDIGTSLGLDNDWAARTIEAVGNTAEIFRRDLGEDSPLQLPRGQNVLLGSGGLFHSLSFN